MIDAYLRELRRQLGDAPDADDIVAEIRSHIDDAGPDVAATLARLGSPSYLAALYAIDRGSSPLVVLRGLARWATISVMGLPALAVVVIGYFLAVSLLLAALIKPVAPHRTGVWQLADGEVSLRLGLFAPPPPHAVELLGWWIVPLGFAAGALVFAITPRFGRWAIRRFGATVVR